MNFTDDVGENKTKNGTNLKICTQKVLLSILCGILFIISTVVLITFIVIYVPKIYTENYAIVIDAGSTGSRAYLYKWKDSADELNDIVYELSRCKAGKLQDLNWADASNNLVKCIASSVADIPTSFLNMPYIYLASTAGMRLYAIENPKEAEVMFNNINAIFAKKHWKTQYVGIITGEVEGISAWITTNFLKSTIGKNVPRQPTIGALDLGGSSTQIAYESTSANQTIDLYSYSYPIYSKSYLCYGTNMFYLMYMTYVAIKPDEPTYSCLLKNTPVVLNDDVKTCRYKGSESIDFKTFSKKVVPDQVNCKKQISAIVNSQMTFDKTPPNTKFVAVSMYNFIYLFLNKYYKAERNLTQFTQYTNQFCQEDYNTISTKFSAEAPYAPTYCVIGMYILELFNGYGITDLSNVEFADKIQGQSVGWNLGYMIDKTRSIPEAYIRKLDTSLFVAIIVIFSIIFVATIISLIYLVWERRQKVANIGV